MENAVRTVWQGGMMLGEGPVWDGAAGQLWFVDIKQHRVHRLDPATAAVETWPAPAQIGWVLPAEGGKLIAGLQSGLATFDPETGAFTPLAEVEPDLPGNRLNDATVGADGTIWFGSMDDGCELATGRLHRFDGTAVTATALPPVPITNGPAFAPDGGTLYHVDTAGGVLHAVTIDADGEPGAMRDFVRIDPDHGNPDGAITDSEGNVWVGIWGGWCARCYAPDGSLLREVRFPCANVTKIALGGPDLKTAYATTAKGDLTDAELAEQPEAGSVFTFAVEVPGNAVPIARLASR
ncbi:SMP-30/gluconolactonase/LRE family protein [Sphingomonas sp. R86521]|uniref:SMP-30/gluconolactonase/LRE family protein n=1 Tax=Sphingomonas sp. R86521 TaxID=3093860 RepID=UPI0036D35A6C